MPSDDFLHNRTAYVAAVHAMQTGVAYVMEKDSSETSAKHLRVGVNSALRDSASLAKLLVKKGIISEDEYMEAIREGMEEEAAEYEKRVRELYNLKNITLG